MHSVLLIASLFGMIAGGSSTSTVCGIIEPFLPKALGCSCESAESGVGGTSTCTKTSPEATLVPGVGFPAVTFAMGAEVLPCGDPASAAIHATISIPGSIPQAIQDQINALVDTSGSGLAYAHDDGTNTLTIDKSVASGAEAENIDIPFATAGVPSVMTAAASFRVGFSVSGTMSDLTVTQTIDMCMTVSETEFCGADLPKCDGDLRSATSCANPMASTSCTAQDYMCIAYAGDWGALVGNPPFTFLTFTASFNDVCPSEDAAEDSTSTPHVVSFSMAASGDLSDYSTEVTDEIATKVAAKLSGVSSTDVRVVVTAGSVNIAIEIDASDESAAETIRGKVETVFIGTGDTAIATSFLQTVSALSSVEVSGVTSPQVKVATTGGDVTPGMIIGIIIGILCAIGLALAYRMAYRALASKVSPKDGADATRAPA